MQQNSPTIASRRLHRLALAGTHGGGKTTLAKALGRSWAFPAITHSRPTAAARQLGYDKAADVSDSDRPLFQWVALFEQIMAERKGRHYVSDRSVLDFYAYYYAEVPVGKHDPSYRAIVGHYAKEYDAIVVVPPNKLMAPQDNGMRYTSDPTDIDLLIRGFVRMFDLQGKTIFLEEDGVEARKWEIEEKLKEMGFEWQ